MKTRHIFIFLSAMIALFLISSQAIAAPQQLDPKATPPGLAKTPEDQAEQTMGNSHGKHENYKGTITAVDASSITLALKDGTAVTVTLTAETDIKILTRKNAPAAELAAGMTVMIQAIRGDDDALTARKVVLIPGKPAKIHRAGIVTAYQAGQSITIQAKDEQYYTFLLTDETKILPAERLDLLVVGARVTIICPRDVSSQDLTAAGIVIHPAVAEE